MSCNTHTVQEGSYHGYQCDPLSTLNDEGNRGIATGGYPVGPNYTISPSDSATITFTCTEPKCYQGKDWCNALFYSYVNSTEYELDVRLT